MTGGFKPLLVCLCGSTDLMEKFAEVNRDETLKGYIVLSVGVNMKDKSQAFLQGKSEAEIAIIKEKLDWLHRRKIDMADVVVILKTAGKELGPSTQQEKEYAERSGKRVEIREFQRTQNEKTLAISAPHRDRRFPGKQVEETCGQRAWPGQETGPQRGMARGVI